MTSGKYLAIFGLGCFAIGFSGKALFDDATGRTQAAGIEATCNTLKAPYKCEDVNNDGYLDVRKFESYAMESVQLYDPETNTFNQPYMRPISH